MALLIRARRLLDVRRGEMLPDPLVAVADGRVREILPGAPAPDPSSGRRVLTFPDGCVLPGLVNTHLHLCAPSRGIPFHRPQSDHAALRWAMRNARTELLSGVTTARDCGDQNGVLFRLRRVAAAGVCRAPRLLLCGPPLTRPGGHAHFLGGAVRGPEGVAQAVRSHLAAGADFIKLIVTGGGTPGTDPARAYYDAGEIAAAVRTAHDCGRPVAAHCRGTPGIRLATAAGVDHIEHACFEQPDGRLRFDARVAAQMAAAGVAVTPTIQLYRDMLAALEKKRLSTGLDAAERRLLARLPDTISRKFAALREFRRFGITCLAGNDAGLPHTGFGRLWRELEAMTAGGLTPLEAIRSATLTAARALRLAGEAGSLAPGMPADLIVVDGDPLKDIRALSRVRLVLQAGRVVTEQP